jgi:hypothetical protein
MAYNEGTTLLEGIQMDKKFSPTQFAGGVVVGYGLAVIVGLAVMKVQSLRIQQVIADEVVDIFPAQVD